MTVDTSAPTAEVVITAITTDSGTSSSDYVTSDTTLTVSGTQGTLNPGEKVQISSDGGANWADVTTSTASTWSYADPNAHATSFTYQARIVDGVGNVGANTASQAVTIDTAAPMAPSITSIPESSGGAINASEASNGTPVVVSLSGTGVVAGDMLTVTWGGQAVGYTLMSADIVAGSATVTVPLATVTAQGQGTFNVTARLTDVAGNAGPNSTATPVTVDTLAPTAPVIASVIDNVAPVTSAVADNGSSNDTTLTIAGMAESDSTVRIYDTDRITVLGTGVATGGVFSITTSVLGQGAHSVTAKATDAAGNQGPASTVFHVTIDTTAPAAPSINLIVENAAGGINAAEASDGTVVEVGLVGTEAVAGDTLTVNWGGQTLSHTIDLSDLFFGYVPVTVPLATITAQGNGTFGVTARLTDAAGNASGNSPTMSVTVDTAAPTAPTIISIAENNGGGINAAEATNGTPVVMGLAGTGAVAGDTLTINWGGQTVNHTLLAADISGGSATVTVPAGTLVAQGQGTFDVTARLTDVAGNVSPNSPVTSVTVDTAAPTAVVAITAISTDSGASSSDYVTNDTTLTVSGTHGPLGPDEKVQASSDGGVNWFDVTTSTASTWSYTDPATHGTSFTYLARIVDGVGNVGASTASQAVTIDTAGPTAPSITSIPENGLGGINAAEAADGTTVVVGLSGTGAAAGDRLTVNWGSQAVTYTLVAGDITGNSATVTVPLATLVAQGQGTFNVTARLTDVAGNAGANSTAVSVTGDATAPTADVVITAIATDSGSSSSDYVTRDTTLTVSGTHGTLNTGEKVQVSSDGGASWADVTTSTASTWSYSDPTTHATSFTYQARIVDGVGNVGANTASQAITVDTTAPTAPSITSIPESAGGSIDTVEASNGTPVVVGLVDTGAAAGDTLTINWGGQAVSYTLLVADISGGSATVTVPLVTIAAQGNGTFNVTASLTDAAGNTGANSTATSVTVATIEPTVVITAIASDSGSSSSDYVTSDTTLTVSGTHGLFVLGEKVQVSSDGGASWADVTTSTASSWSYTDPTPHASNFIYQARIVDTGNNVGATASQAITIDTAAPVAPSISSIPENGLGGINAAEAADGTTVVVGLSGTGAAAGDRLTVNWGSQAVTYTLVAGDISGNSATVTVPLATLVAQGQGTFGVTARLTDVAGNAGPNSTAVSVTGDATAPTADVVIATISTDSGTSSSDYITGDTTLVVSGTNGALGPGEKIQVSSDGGASWADATSSTANSWSYTDPTTHGTSFAYQARIVDGVGNVGANTASQAITVDTAAPTAPSITSIPENGGGGISAAEATNGTPVVVGLSGTAAAAGDTLTITWGSQAVGYTLLASDVTGNSATVTVPAGTIAAQGDGTFNATATLTDAAGNASPTSTPILATVDTTADTGPTVAVTVSDPLVSNAEKTAVEFTLSGLDPDAGADVTFTGAAGTSVVVHVNGNAPATANLSGLDNGPVAVSVVATDTAGNTATGTSTYFTLDTTADVDGDLTLSILSDTSINASERRRPVVFTTSGIDGDVTNTSVRFTDSVGNMIAVAASAGFVLLDSFVGGQITSTVTVTDAAGNTASAPGVPLTLDLVNGTDGPDRLLGTSGNDTYNGLDGDDTLGGGPGDDTLNGDGGNDTIFGGSGNDTINGGTGANTVSGGEGSDWFDFLAGANTGRDTLADLNGDRFSGFGSDDALDITGSLIGRSALTVTGGTATLSSGGLTVLLEGNFLGGDFMTVARGVGAGAHTLVTFVNFLPNLGESSTVDPAWINGVANQPFLTGDGSVRFMLDLESAVSEYRNALGVYKVANDGTILDVSVIFNNTLNVAASTIDLGVPENNERIGFFLIQDGFDIYGNLPNDLSFVVPGTTTPASLDSGVPPTLHSEAFGDLTAASIFHSFSTLNPGDAVQVLSGVTPGGLALQIGFEDLPGSMGDNDFQDVLVRVRTIPDGYLI